MFSLYVRALRKFRCCLITPVFMLLIYGCLPQATGPGRPYFQEGSPFFLYFKPLTADIASLRFLVDRVEVITDEGERLPLSLNLPEISLQTVDRQRLFASGRLPPGKYRGLAVTVHKVWTMTEEGEVELLPPSKPEEVPLSFVLGKDEGKLVEIAYHPDESVRHNVIFSPSLTAYIPDRSLVSRIGYVGFPEAGYLAVFDRISMTVNGIVAAAGPAGIAIDQKRQRTYVAVEDADQVEILDLVSGAKINRIEMRSGDRPVKLALSPDGSLLLVVNSDSNSVSYIDTESLLEVERLAVGESPRDVLIDSKGQWAYVFNSRSNFISILDVREPKVLISFATENPPYRGTFNSDESRLYFLQYDSPYLSVLDIQSMTVVNRTLVGSNCSDLLVDPNTDLIYLGRRGDAAVEIYDPFTLEPIGSLNDVGTPVDMVIDDEENRLLLAIPSIPGVMAVDLISRRPMGFVETGAPPGNLDISGARR